MVYCHTTQDNHVDGCSFIAGKSYMIDHYIPRVEVTVYFENMEIAGKRFYFFKNQFSDETNNYDDYFVKASIFVKKDIERAKKKWKPMFVAVKKIYPTVKENELVYFLEEILYNNTDIDIRWNESELTTETRRSDLHKYPDLPMMINVACELGIFKYVGVIGHYRRFVKTLPDEYFERNGVSIKKYLKTFIRNYKLKQLDK